MSKRKREMLRRTLIGIQAHAAGMQAASELALHLLGELDDPGPANTLLEQLAGRRGSPTHYGDPEPKPAEAMEAHFANLSQRGTAPTARGSGEQPQEE